MVLFALSRLWIVNTIFPVRHVQQKCCGCEITKNAAGKSNRVFKATCSGAGYHGLQSRRRTQRRPSIVTFSIVDNVILPVDTGAAFVPVMAAITANVAKVTARSNFLVFQLPS